MAKVAYVVLGITMDGRRGIHACGAHTTPPAGTGADKEFQSNRAIICTQFLASFELRLHKIFWSACWEIVEVKTGFHLHL